MNCNVMAPTSQNSTTFSEDVRFLGEHTQIIRLLANNDESQILVAPAWQGRVMTSTCAEDDGPSFGWINYDLVEKGIAPEAERSGIEKHIHVFGGEERIWLGPEGGQYSLFFAPSTRDYDFDSWKTPALMDTEAFDVVEKFSSSVSFKKSGALVNKAGFEFDFVIARNVKLLGVAETEQLIGTKVDSAVNSRSKAPIH